MKIKIVDCRIILRKGGIITLSDIFMFQGNTDLNSYIQHAISHGYGIEVILLQPVSLPC